MGHDSAAHDSTPATPATAVGAWTRRVLLLGFLAPALSILAAGVPELFAPEGYAPITALSLAPALFWALLVLRRPWRAMLVEIGRLILAHVSLPVLFICAVIGFFVALGESSGLLALALETWLVAMTLAKAADLAAREPAVLARQAALIAINVAILVAADYPVRKFVLPASSHDDVFIEHDATLGWKLRPNASNARRTSLYHSLESVNELGFRTPSVPFEKPAGTRRVVVLGDSHTEGYTVDDERTYCAQLQRLLSVQGPVEVVSLGVGGFSTDQEYLAYLHYGRRFEPDLVLLQTCSNDPEMNVLDHYWRGKKPLFERHADQLLLTGVPVPDLRDTGLLSREFLKRSSLLVVIEGVLRQISVKRELATVVDWDEAWRVTELLVRDLGAVVDADGARLAAFNANPRVERDFDLGVRALLARQGVPYLETDACYTDAFDSYWYGTHWNEKGQTAVAEALAPQIAKLLSEPASPRAGAAKTAAPAHDR